MWNIQSQAVPSGLLLKVLREDTPLSFRELFDVLQSNANFAHWYSDTLAACEFDAFFWEFPPLTAATLDHDAEFVLIESAALAGLRADPRPFASQFVRQPESNVITFPNLGGDALLIVPAQAGSAEAYPHLAAFLRHAPREQVRLLWKIAGEVVDQKIGDSPRWLSTAGLGIAWLHLRLDTRPKYYSHLPYKTAA